MSEPNERARVDDSYGSVLPPARTLSQIIGYLSDGFDISAGRDISDLLARLEQRAIDGEAVLKAEVTLKLKIVRGPDGAYEITPIQTMKEPAKPTIRTMMWADANHNFSVANPKQMAMRFQRVGDAGPARRVE